MRAVLRATAILAGSSAVSVGAGIASAKAWALLVGPDGIGFLGVLQSVVGLGSMIAALGVGTGLVRLGAAALGRDDPRGAAAFRRAAKLCTWVLGSGTVLAVALLREPLSQWVLGGSDHGDAVVLMSLAILFTLLSGVEISTLNAYHRVSALARVSIVGSVSGAIVGIALVWRWGEAAIPFAVLTLPLTSWLAAVWLVRREIGTIRFDHSAAEVLDAARALLRFGTPYMGSMLVGSGVQLLIPIVVVHQLGTDGVGYYRAATTIAIGYVGFLLTAMSQDYYPRVSAAREGADLTAMVNQQIRLVILVGVPVVLVGLVATPLLVPLLYAPSFAPAVPVLEWLWVGNAFKLWSWALSFVVLARCSSRHFFFIEAAAGGTMLLASLAAIALFGVEGLGIAFLVTSVVYAAVVWGLVRRETGFVIESRNGYLSGLALATTVVAHSLLQTEIGSARHVLAIVLVAVVALICATMVWREVGRSEKGGPPGPSPQSTRGGRPALRWNQESVKNGSQP